MIDHFLVPDSDKIIHACRPVAHRLRALCDYLDVDATTPKHEVVKNLDAVTCDHCHLLMLEARAVSRKP